MHLGGWYVYLVSIRSWIRFSPKQRQGMGRMRRQACKNQSDSKMKYTCSLVGVLGQAAKLSQPQCPQL